MPESGVVVYRVESSDRLGATWLYSGLKGGRPGKGTATGDTSGGFAGDYRVVYDAPDGSEQWRYDLAVVRDGQVFRLTWATADGRLAYEGVGFETEGGLVASYAPVEGSPHERHAGG